MLDKLRSIVQAVNRSNNLSEGLQLAVEKVCETLQVGVCSVYLLNKNRTHCILTANCGLKNPTKGLRIRLGEGPVGRIVAQGRTVMHRDITLVKDAVMLPELHEGHCRAFLGVPIVHRRRIVGVLVVQQDQPRLFDSDELSFVITLAAQLAAVVAHGEVENSSEEDDNDQGVDGAVFQGVSGVAGIGIGEAVVVTADVDLDSVPSRRCLDPEAEVRIFESCLQAVREEIAALGSKLERYLAKAERGLFDAYLRMLDKDGLGDEITEKIRQGQWAEGAVSQVVLAHAGNFEKIGDDYLRERATDIRDLGKRILRRLRHLETQRDYPDQIILAGEELSPAALGEVPTARLVGLISVRGSHSSHAAVLARALGIPTVMGVPKLPLPRVDGKMTIVDGHRNMIFISPNEALGKGYQEMRESERVVARELLDLRDKPCELTDGHRVNLWVNTGLAVDTSVSQTSGAEGVGLFRTEIPFMLGQNFPDEEAQRKIYRSHLQAFFPRPVTMRTLDIGGDKPLPYFPISDENPFLGWRGIRISVDHPEMFIVQLRAMLKASEGLNNLRIMLPMISNLDELSFALNLIHGVHSELLAEGHRVKMPDVGVLIEVPAAVYQSRSYARHTDFLSVGSNDLTQYLLAVDRNNSQVADLYQPLHPSVLQALKIVAENAHMEHKPISLCGDMAGDPLAVLLLPAMGFDILSMGAANLLRIKAILRHFSLRRLKQILQQAEQMEKAAEVREYLLEVLHQADLGHLLGPNYKGI